MAGPFLTTRIQPAATKKVAGWTGQGWLPPPPFAGLHLAAGLDSRRWGALSLKKGLGLWMGGGLHAHGREIMGAVARLRPTNLC